MKMKTGLKGVMLSITAGSIAASADSKIVLLITTPLYACCSRVLVQCAVLAIVDDR